MHGHVLVGYMRWELPYVVEWINWHLFVGFDHIVIYNNDDATNYNAMAELLAAYSSEHVLTLLYWPKHGDQRGAYSDAYDRFLPRASTITILDGDEFLVVCNPASTKIGAIYEASGIMRSHDPGCRGLGWYQYGTSHLQTHPPNASVLATYTLRAAYDERRHDGHGKIVFSGGRRGVGTRPDSGFQHYCRMALDGSYAETAAAGMVPEMFWRLPISHARIHHYERRGGDSNYARRVSRGCSGAHTGQCKVYGRPLWVLRAEDEWLNLYRDPSGCDAPRALPGLLQNRPALPSPTASGFKFCAVEQYVGPPPKPAKAPAPASWWQRLARNIAAAFASSSPAIPNASAWAVQNGLGCK